MRIPVKRYRVECKDSPSVSPFPAHIWLTRAFAEKFCASDDAGQWKGKLRVIKDDGGIRVRYGRMGKS